jgi:hypothetical protein
VKRTSKNTRKKHLTTAILRLSPDATTVAVGGARTSQPQINIGKKLKKIFDRREKTS